ncbi:hypothetical protein HZB60_07460 [candidate division KSB1 bacterium]|nr:hypothetical protein [candidate division KSB1 bacterium]
MSAHEIAARVIAPDLIRDCNVVLFEDPAVETDLFPLAVTRPAWEIRSGMGCLREWVVQSLDFGLGLRLAPRAHLSGMATYLAPSDSDDWGEDSDVLFLNGRVIAMWPEGEAQTGQLGTVVDEAGCALWSRLPAVQAAKFLRLPGTEIATRLVQDSRTTPVTGAGYAIRYARYSWDYMRHNAELLGRQLLSQGKTAIELCGAHLLREPPAGVQVTDKVNGFPVYAGAGVKLMPGTVFGNQHGPIWIGAGTEVEPHTYLEGPLYVGPNCRIKAGCRLYHGTSLGPVCRVAGEITESIMQGYSNKQHDGFLGNSHLGSWVNLGADTRTSNLRNDYGEVKVQIGPYRIPTGQRYIGLLAGDHVKTGINTMFNTATVVGPAANVYGAGYPPQYIESFMWGGKDGLKPGALDRTLATARFAMSRRGIELTDFEVELLSRHYAERITEGTRA